MPVNFKYNQKSKYGNTKVQYDGVVFDSKKELSRYVYLKMLQKSGEISELTLQPKFVLQDKFKYRNERIREIVYIADFMYKSGACYIVEDVKGFETKDFAIKLKMFKYRYPGYIINII